MRRHPRARRLQILFDMAEKAEQQALQEWGQLQQKLHQEEEQRTQLSGYANEYQQQLSVPSGKALSSGFLHNTLGFIGQIETALKTQNEQIKLLQDRVTAARNQYLEHHGKVKALSGLMDRLDHEYDQQADKELQKQSDEWANRAAFQNSRTPRT
ncbi:flagellar export protein FliJ [Thalassolituus pacificus]|uniref:Flagellar FliJ protein n=1 Tax=Thalassolituus pacificus TaxID=2975440 RepID=A0A9X3AR75_9GAMM|nr:flagellar export protein FliJ [Thalassolituus pacificus]MCT7357468.1 flagellar export protein FliJ [Thalassolituus pacificus]